MSTIDIFPTTIYKTSYNEIESLQADILPGLEDIFLKAEKNNQRNIKQGVSSFDIISDLHTQDTYKTLVEFINCHAQVYWKTLGYSTKLNPVIRHMWANRYNSNGYIELHNHSPINIVGTFYLKKQADVANIVLEHPNHILLNHQPIAYGPTAYKQFEQEINTESGDLLMFPGYLQHRTLVNTSTEDRIIIGFNITGVL
jgi:uncharacterized protein (TIGR02466 family)